MSNWLLRHFDSILKIRLDERGTLFCRVSSVQKSAKKRETWW